MKFNPILIIGTSLIIGTAACERIEDPDTIVFEVFAEKEIYKVGDSVRFVFEGNPDIIAFYSGELGNSYEYKDGRIAEPDYLINFETQSQNGAQTDQMRVLVSNDFTGDYSIDGVHAATWSDITSRFTMAPPNNGSAYVSSGFGDLEEFLDTEKDTIELYFAVKQIVKNQNIHGLGNLNRLRYFTISSVYETLNKKLYEHANFGWTLFSTPNKQPDRASLENSYTIMMRNSWWTSPEDYYSRETEDWAVSIPVKLPRALDLGPDRSISIKGVTDISVKGYTYIYTTPGEYNVVFKAINANIKSQNEITKEITLIVTN